MKFQPHHLIRAELCIVHNHFCNNSSHQHVVSPTQNIRTQLHSHQKTFVPKTFDNFKLGSEQSDDTIRKTKKFMIHNNKNRGHMHQSNDNSNFIAHGFSSGTRRVARELDMEYIPFHQLSHAPKQKQEIVNLAKGRLCRACPNTHFNSGNIIYHDCKPIAGKVVKWPGWKTNLVQVVIQATDAAGTYTIRSIQWYKKASVVQPGQNASYNHVGIQTSDPAPYLHKKDRDNIDAIYHDMNISKQSSAFWCMRNKTNCTMYIFQVDFVPFQAVFYQDVNLLDRRDEHMFLVTRQSILTNYTNPVQTHMGPIQVLDNDGRSDEEVAHNLAEQLLDNCRRC